MAKETILDEKLLQDISEYCKLNEIEPISVFINKLLREAYMDFKWGDRAPGVQESEGESKKTEPTPEKEEIRDDKPPMKNILNNDKSDFYGE